MNNQPAILVIDDEPQILRALKTILGSKQFKVFSASRGEEGITLAATQKPDLIILDLSLPDISGMEVCSRIREWSQVPIIILSVRDNERDKVRALDLGADDYLTKPFGIEELLARIRVALRHSALSSSKQQAVISSGPVEIDLVKHIVTRNGTEIKLTATEFKVLAYLASHADRVLTHQAILNHVWDYADSDRVEYLRVYIGQIRKKIETNPEEPEIIITESGVGYRFLTDK